MTQLGGSCSCGRVSVRTSVDFEQDRVIRIEFAGKGRAAGDHVGIVFHSECQGVLLGRPVPRDEVQVVVHCGVAEQQAIANHGVEVAFRRRYEVGVVQKQHARQVVVP